MTDFGLLRVELDDALFELPRELRDPRVMIGAGRDDDVVGEERVARCYNSERIERRASESLSTLIHVRTLSSNLRAYASR